MDKHGHHSSAGRRCFVTIGATASFDGLLRAVLEDSFIRKLAGLGYTDLQVQYGQGGHSIVSQSLGLGRITSEHLTRLHGLNISGFDFREEGLGLEMAAAKGAGDSQGVVISHAGTGSILEALRIGIPLIVVPNAVLLHNHQEELAEELARQGYIVHGKLDGLPAALDSIEQLQEQRQPWPPQQSDLDPTGKGLMGVLDDEMGFLD